MVSLHLSCLLFFFSKRCQSSSALPLQITIVQIAAAHICYLVAEANFESYSDSARLCLIGADHWKFPRTYASPEAIQVLFVVIWLINLSFMKSGNFLIFCMLKWVL